MQGQEKVRAKVIRPNIECTDGYIHLIDTAMLDDAPPWTITASFAVNLKPSLLILYALNCLMYLQ